MSVSTGSLPWDTIPAMLSDRFQQSSTEEALIDGDTRLSYADLNSYVQRAAASLLALEVKPGDIIHIWSTNSWQWVASAVACWWVGGIVAPLSARIKGLEALPILQQTQARILFCSSDANGVNLPALLATHLAEIDQSIGIALPALQCIVDLDRADDSGISLGWNKFLQLGEGSGYVKASRVLPTDTCEIMFTSGTTGRPKGVMLGHAALLRAYWNASLTRGFSARDRQLVVPAYSHVSGLNGGIFRCLMMGMAQIIVRRFRPTQVLELLASEAVSCMAGPSSLFSQLLAEEQRGNAVIHKLRFVSTGAAYIPPKMVHELRQRGVSFVCSPYGMTECAPICETRLDDTPEVIATTVGKPVAGISVRLVDDAEQDVATGDAGEILVRGSGVMQGYYRDEAQTQAAFTHDGWLRTGDMGRFTSAGNLCIVGRKKDMFIVHGFNVYPAEVETQLMQSGQLENVAVVGRANRFTGEECVAFVVPAKAAGFSRKRLLAWAREHMADFKVPAEVVLSDSLPLNANGKIDKELLRQQLEKPPAPATPEPH